MSRTIYSASMSLEGFIAGPGGDMRWLLPYFGPDPMAARLLEETGALLIGRRTFDVEDPTSTWSPATALWYDVPR